MTSWVLRLLVLNVAIFLIGTISPQVGDALFRLGVLVPALIDQRPWTIVTYMFLHQGFAHIFFNMIGLLIFGPRLEAYLGGTRFILLYLVSGICGALLSFVFTPITQILGASGAILGITLGFARYWPREQIYVWFVPMQARLLVVLYVVMDLFGGFGPGGGGGVAHFAHLGGLAGAYVFLKIVERRGNIPAVKPKTKSIRPPARNDVERWSKIDPSQLHPVNREEYDRVMQKIEREGPASLDERERSFLDTFSDR